jgi:hypothetical protein
MMNEQSRMDPMALTGEEEPSGPVGFTIIIEEGEPKVYPVEGYRAPEVTEIFQAVWGVMGILLIEGMGVDAVEPDKDTSTGQ